MTPELRPITDRLPPSHGRQVRAFLCVRNNLERLPYLLSHYRRAGVAWFFIIDNHSQDGTAEFLRTQPDCSAFSAAGAFGAANHGMDWVNALLEEHGIGHWRLYVDADEILVYPHAEDLPLPVFCDYLQAREYEGAYAFMLDMYSADPVAKAHYESGQDFLDVCPLFDPDYEFRNRLRLPGAGARFPTFEVVGGPRLRRFYPEFRNQGMLRYALPRGLMKLCHSRVGRALRAARWLRGTASPPLLSKIPLTFGSPGRVYVISHRTVPLRLAPITGVLLHFKFFADFHRRVTTVLVEGQHFNGGSEYARYAAALQAEPEFSLAFPGSLRYRDSDDLVARGLIKTDPDYEAFWSGWQGRGHHAHAPRVLEPPIAVR
jgi:hypothetical protein